MALLTLMLVLCIGLQGHALTLTLNTDAEAMRVTGDVCQDCTKIFELLVDMLSNADLQKKIMKAIETVCDHLPGPGTAAICKAEVEKMFPLAINFITSVAKPAQVCKAIGLCSSCDKEDKMLEYLVKEALQAMEATPQCSFCIFLVKTLEDMLPKERTEAAVTKALEEICHIMPSSYRDQCKNIIDKFSKSVLEAIEGYASPHTICTLIHMCKGQEDPVDPCTLTKYRCRDMNAALRCGTVFYCQRFSWKSLNYNRM
ncbi:surfactant protein Ba isoform X2 [Echeneis naucrates]|uniref:surfactant protein Ba isoform X2 n=1 Tax=Echeneis naucrates TaxID=173247 RepID=UPI001114334F|nr:prosaposin-like isoform X2 [Echeneis naucrates]